MTSDETQTAGEPQNEQAAAAPISASPRPGPRPGPQRPVPRPPTAPQAPVVPASDPRRFGRVAEDGTVYLVTPAGERVIGSWQAGEPEAAFEHFGRRFDDLATEVTLMETRLTSGTGDARKIKSAAAALAESLSTAAVLGDVDALAARLAAIAEHAGETVAADRARREEQRAAQTARKEALAVEAEDLAANATQWKLAGDRMRAILDEWRTITGLDRKTDDALWKRYSAARDAFNRRRGAHFAELDRERAGVREAKERLCVRAEALADSTDWVATANAFRELLAEWKAAGRAAKDTDDTLWHRFKAAQDRFFAARNAVNAERDAEFHANGEAKEKLLAEAEKIDVSNLKAAQAAVRAITDKWDAIGKTPRDTSAELERRLRAVEKKIRDAADAGRIDPEAQARAEQFRSRAEQFERQAEKAAAAGRDKEANEARASAAQWHEWAAAAAQAVAKRR
ncbi:MAG: DUF349 domain-containing protein [Mycobacterium sp.]